MAQDNQAHESLEQPNNEAYQDQVWTELSSTSKNWKYSKTIWFNIAVTTAGFVTTVLPFAQPFIKPRHFGLITTGIGVINMALRCISSDDIKKGE